MSIKKFPGAVISDVPVEPAGNYQDSAASGVWTLEQQAYWEAQGLWPVPGNTNPDLFIENLFSTYLYTGNGSTQTITNGIDLDGEGGLVWIKQRNAAIEHFLFDTERGATKSLSSNDTTSEYTSATTLTGFNADGFALGSSNFVNGTTSGPRNYASWTFRKAPKFFDVVTYTGNGTSGRQIAHSLESVPGMIIVKRTDATRNWCVYHRSLGNTNQIILNSTAALESTALWNSTNPTSTNFTVNNDLDVNGSGATYVAYLFAHDAGGFGDDGLQNVISCGSFTTDGAGAATVNLGYEPQWILYKESSNGGENWSIADYMRGMPVTGNVQELFPNNTSSESTAGISVRPNSTGFTFGPGWYSGRTFIYIAIRRGPMATPTSGTEVFGAIARAGTGAAATVTGVGFSPDLVIGKGRNSGAQTSAAFTDKLRGIRRELYSAATAAEVTEGTSIGAVNAFTMDGFNLDADASGGYYNWSAGTYINWCLRRAPSVFDVVAFTSSVTFPTTTTVSHNLGVVPEIIIKKARDTNSTSNTWRVYHKGLNNGVNPQNYAIRLDSTGAQSTSAEDWGATAPTSTQFTAGFVESSIHYINYLFATLPGVSKVGSYTGTAADLNVDCGFTTGARFVLIKRTDSTGDWYVWDSARGIVAGNDPYLLLNSTAAEVTSTDYVDADPAGFTVTSSAPAALNASGGSYIFLAIA
jgi:hypothetical protein